MGHVGVGGVCYAGVGWGGSCRGGVGHAGIGVGHVGVGWVVEDLQKNHVKVVNFEFSMTDPPPLCDTPHPLWIS